MRNRWTFLAFPIFLSSQNILNHYAFLIIADVTQSESGPFKPLNSMKTVLCHFWYSCVICRKSYQKEWVHRLTSCCAKKNSARDVYCSLKYCTVSLIGFTAQSVFALAAGAIGNNFLWKERSGETPRQWVRMCSEERTADDVTLTVQAPESWETVTLVPGHSIDLPNTSKVLSDSSWNFSQSLWIQLSNSHSWQIKMHLAVSC